MDYTIYIIIGFLVIFGIVMAMALRASKMKRFNIKGDVRNPSRKPFMRYGTFNRGNSIVNVYKSAFSFFPEKKYGWYDNNAVESNKIIDCYLGISGKPDDDMMYPVTNTIMSGAMADSFNTQIQNKIYSTLREFTPNEINEPDLFEKKLKSSFNKEWVMKSFGVIEIKDANLILQHQKMQVADLHSRTNEFKKQHLSWAAQWGPIMMYGMMFLVIIIGAILLWNNIPASTSALNQIATELGPLLKTAAHNATTAPLPTGTG